MSQRKRSCFEPHALVALKEHRFQSRLELKEGILVILLVNLDISSGLANTSQGVITGFEPYEVKSSTTEGYDNTKPTHTAHDPGAKKAHSTQSRHPPVNLPPVSGEYEEELRSQNLRSFIEAQPASERVWRK